MSEPPHTHSRRLQFRIRDLLILTGLLAVVWWQATRWPVTYPIVPATSTSSEGVFAFELQEGETLYSNMIERKPTTIEIIKRGAIGSALAIGAWFGIVLVAQRIRHRSET